MPSYTKQFLESPKIWNLASLTVYDMQGRVFFHNKYLEIDYKVNHTLVTNVIEILASFSRNNFQEEIHELNFGDYRLIFDTIGNYIFLSSVLIGDSVDTGFHSTMHKSIKRLNKIIFDRINKQSQPNSQLDFDRFNSNFIDVIVGTINDSSNNPDSVFHNIQNFENLNNWFVSSVIVLDEFGTPYVTRTYHQGIFQDDPILLSGLIAAIKVFSEEAFSDKLQEIVLGRYRLLFHTYGGKLYVIVIELEDEFATLNHNSTLFREIDKLFHNLIETTSFLNEINSISLNHHSITSVVDALVIKTIRKPGQSFVNVYDQHNLSYRSNKQKQASITKGVRIKMQDEYVRAQKYSSGSIFKSMFRKVSSIWS